MVPFTFNPSPAAVAFRPQPAPVTCQGMCIYFACGCLSTAGPIKMCPRPGCSHEDLTLVVGRNPDTCRGRVGQGDRCRAPGAGAYSYIREADTANAQRLTYLRDCPVDDIPSMVPARVSCVAALTQEVRDHFNRRVRELRPVPAPIAPPKPAAAVAVEIPASKEVSKKFPLPPVASVVSEDMVSSIEAGVEDVEDASSHEEEADWDSKSEDEHIEDENMDSILDADSAYYMDLLQEESAGAVQGGFFGRLRFF
ncbi:hypothetical protein F5Y15DRAFT_423287 [Xylariaceae sp. FL0016]|nr:hypothetical protein F5Y15DRAFT_423287 [Xylariaceae sp. FL0016]